MAGAGGQQPAGQPYGCSATASSTTTSYRLGCSERTESKSRRPPCRAYSSRPNSAPTPAPIIRPQKGDAQGGDEGVHPVDQAEEPADQDTGKDDAHRCVEGGPAVVHTADDLLDKADVLADDRHPLYWKPLAREVVDGAFGFPVRLVLGNAPPRLPGHRPVLPTGTHGRPRHPPGSRTEQLYACTRQVKEQRNRSPREHETKTPNTSGEPVAEGYAKTAHLSERSGKE